MDIQGKVIKILGTQQFASRKDGSAVVKNSFVVETQEQYPKKVCIVVFGEQRYADMHIVMGGSYTISCDVESREFNDKWYTEVSAWRAVAMQS